MTYLCRRLKGRRRARNSDETSLEDHKCGGVTITRRGADVLSLIDDRGQELLPEQSGLPRVFGVYPCLGMRPRQRFGRPCSGVEISEVLE